MPRKCYAFSRNDGLLDSTNFVRDSAICVFLNNRSNGILRQQNQLKTVLCGSIVRWIRGLCRKIRAKIGLIRPSSEDFSSSREYAHETTHYHA
ncbi:hypothetical protein, partial [Helicobacter sp. 23-1045]